ncbi:MAG: 6-hydroxymethylpterin diphosphokinase MptE-like protein [Phycisphaerales bacterium]
MPAHALSATVLEANLRALATGNRRLVEALRATAERDDVTFFAASHEDGMVSASIQDFGPTGFIDRLLASRRNPRIEAERLIERVETAAHPTIVVMGFGLGHHVAALARRVNREGLIVVFEPDLGLLRTVLGHIDHSDWLNQTNVLLITDSTDEGAMAASLQGLEGLLAMGVHMVAHPASRPRLAKQAEDFARVFTKVMKAVRTTVVTTMMQTEATVRNLLQNLDVYSTGHGINDVQGKYAGRAAVVVSAGPSLARNIAALSAPGVRDRVVIVAVQTVLKTLLAHGIRPHYVTALDYHEISRRFYEGLTADDVRGVELVIEPKVNPAVPAAFPGVIRCARDGYLDKVLGETLARPMGAIAPGATVAHLAYSFARHLGCDPVILVGQDLGFTDGQYYASGAAIHDVWAGEVNNFNTVEMLEWQRIVRGRAHLRRETDQLGRSIFTDEQMATYLVQFQREFKADAERGLTTIDATEGGVCKAFTTIMPLAEALSRAPVPATAAGSAPVASPSASERVTASRRERERLFKREVAERVRDLRHDVFVIARRSRDVRVMLAEMLEHQRDQERVNRLIGKVEQVRDEVMKLSAAFDLIETLNQTGSFNRLKADRAINLDRGLTAEQVQQRQIERDIVNVEWLADAADVLGTMLEDAVSTLSGGPRQTRDPSINPEKLSLLKCGADPATLRVVAVVDATVEAGSGAGAEPVWGRANALQLTLARLARCASISGAAIITHDEQATRRLIGAPPGALRLSFHTADPCDAFDPAAIRAARAFAPECYRGGLGNLTCYDEVLHPGTTARLLRECEAEAALVVGATWSLIDPALCDSAIARYREQPKAHRLTFSQAVPGFCGCVVDVTMLEQIRDARANAGSFASIGGVLGYVPTSPVPDMLGKPMCLPVPVAVRDAGVRATIDRWGEGRAVLEAASRAGLDPLSASAEDLARVAATLKPTGAQHVILRLVDGAGRFLEGRAALAAFSAHARCGAAVTIRGEDVVTGAAGPVARDVLENPWWRQIIRGLREAGAAAVHVRTFLRCPADQVGELLYAGPDVVSVDLISLERDGYLALAGVDAFDTVQANLTRLMHGRTAPKDGSGLATPWVVPRLTRRDRVYEQVERFFDYGMLNAGWAVLDPLPRVMSGERIKPIAVPPAANRRMARSAIEIGADGRVVPLGGSAP